MGAPWTGKGGRHGVAEWFSGAYGLVSTVSAADRCGGLPVLHHLPRAGPRVRGLPAGGPHRQGERPSDAEPDLSYRLDRPDAAAHCAGGLGQAGASGYAELPPPKAGHGYHRPGRPCGQLPSGHGCPGGGLPDLSLRASGDGGGLCHLFLPVYGGAQCRAGDL